MLFIYPIAIWQALFLPTTPARVAVSQRKREETCRPVD
jgi:hypothetical protein